MDEIYTVPDKVFFRDISDEKNTRSLLFKNNTNDHVQALVSLPITNNFDLNISGEEFVREENPPHLKFFLPPKGTTKVSVDLLLPSAVLQGSSCFQDLIVTVLGDRVLLVPLKVIGKLNAQAEGGSFADPTGAKVFPPLEDLESQACMYLGDLRAAYNYLDIEDSPNLWKTPAAAAAAAVAASAEQAAVVVSRPGAGAAAVWDAGFGGDHGAEEPPALEEEDVVPPVGHSGPAALSSVHHQDDEHFDMNTPVTYVLNKSVVVRGRTAVVQSTALLGVADDLTDPESKAIGASDPFLGLRMGEPERGWPAVQAPAAAPFAADSSYKLNRGSSFTRLNSSQFSGDAEGGGDAPYVFRVDGQLCNARGEEAPAAASGSVLDCGSSANVPGFFRRLLRDADKSLDPQQLAQSLIDERLNLLEAFQCNKVASVHEPVPSSSNWGRYQSPNSHRDLGRQMPATDSRRQATDRMPTSASTSPFRKTTETTASHFSGGMGGDNSRRSPSIRFQESGGAARGSRVGPSALTLTGERRLGVEDYSSASSIGIGKLTTEIPWPSSGAPPPSLTPPRQPAAALLAVTMASSADNGRRLTSAGGSRVSLVPLPTPLGGPPLSFPSSNGRPLSGSGRFPGDGDPGGNGASPVPRPPSASMAMAMAVAGSRPENEMLRSAALAAALQDLGLTDIPLPTHVKASGPRGGGGRGVAFLAALPLPGASGRPLALGRSPGRTTDFGSSVPGSSGSVQVAMPTGRAGDANAAAENPSWGVVNYGGASGNSGGGGAIKYSLPPNYRPSSGRRSLTPSSAAVEALPGDEGHEGRRHNSSNVADGSAKNARGLYATSTTPLASAKDVVGDDDGRDLEDDDIESRLMGQIEMHLRRESGNLVGGPGAPLVRMKSSISSVPSSFASPGVPLQPLRADLGKVAPPFLPYSATSSLGRQGAASGGLGGKVTPARNATLPRGNSVGGGGASASAGKRGSLGNLAAGSPGHLQKKTSASSESELGGGPKKTGMVSNAVATGVAQTNTSSAAYDVMDDDDDDYSGGPGIDATGGSYGELRYGDEDDDADDDGSWDVRIQNQIQEDGAVVGRMGGGGYTSTDRGANTISKALAASTLTRSPSGAMSSERGRRSSSLRSDARSPPAAAVTANRSRMQNNWDALG